MLYRKGDLLPLLLRNIATIELHMSIPQRVDSTDVSPSLQQRIHNYSTIITNIKFTHKFERTGLESITQNSKSE